MEVVLKLNNIPFNIDLLNLRQEDLKTLSPITSLDIFLPSSKQFHSEGLFSTEIFGKVGTEHRNRRFAYIDARVELFHPLIYKALTDLREFYSDIMGQKKYAIWNDDIKDFEPSDPINGKTGMSFFIKHWKDIKHEERPSPKRQFNIRLVEKYKDRALMRYVLVLPAGLRDYEIDENGKPEEGEVNTIYRKILGMSNLISMDLYKLDPESVDSTRHNIQMALVDLYNYFRSLLEGKSKFITGKWTARRIFNSTRNVISTVNNKASHADDPSTLKFNETAVGLFQHVKAIIPLSVYQLRESYLSKVFPGPNTPAILINPKTLKKEPVQVSPDHYDEWMSIEGITNVLNRFGERDLRHVELMVDKHYLGLIYKGPDMTFRFLQDIDDVPDESYKQYVSPITFAELLYISVFKEANKIPGFFTRYPIAGYGSVYPSYTHLKSTEPYEAREELDDNWEKTGIVAIEFPMRNQPFFDTLACHQSHIARLTADYDGDVCSWTAVITDEARQEVEDKLNSVGYYVDPNGKMYFSAETDTIKMTLGYMTR